MEPFNELRVKFADARVKYGLSPFYLLVEEECGGPREPPQESFLGFCGLPFADSNGDVTCDIACRWYGIALAEDTIGDWGSHTPWEPYNTKAEEMQTSKEALQLFIELATRAAAALPASVRDAITPQILEDMKVHYDPHPPSELIVWWLVYLWWQFDREFYANSVSTRRLMVPRRPGFGNGKYVNAVDNGRFVIWRDPFMASVSAIDRGGLLYEVPPEEIQLRDVDEERAEEERQKSGYSDGSEDQAPSNSPGWFKCDPSPTSDYKLGPLEGTMTELAKWTDSNRGTLKVNNGKGHFHIRQVEFRKFKLWCDSQQEFTDCCTRRDNDKVPVNRPKVAGEMSRKAAK